MGDKVHYQYLGVDICPARHDRKAVRTTPKKNRPQDTQGSAKSQTHSANVERRIFHGLSKLRDGSAH